LLREAFLMMDWLCFAKPIHFDLVFCFVCFAKSILYDGLALLRKAFPSWWMGFASQRLFNDGLALLRKANQF